MASLRRSIIVSLLFTIFGGPGISLLLVPFLITRFHIPPQPLPQSILAALFICIGLVPALESVRRFIYVGRGTLMPTVPTEKLVVSGFYRYVRNPMYCGVLIVLIGENILFCNSGILIYLFIWWFLIDLFIRKYEEPTLRKRYAGEYTTFCANVHRWLPRLRPWQH